ncbi:hypothetical protein AAF712_010894 [Marasmius tenuissimus]|uniref:Uncharacterized protein n=1 Tax=Marasmius tenuissimus TaxID=585030 RepID=A0ABR2ZM20_9AGAR
MLTSSPEPLEAQLPPDLHLRNSHNKDQKVEELAAPAGFSFVAKIEKPKRTRSFFDNGPMGFMPLPVLLNRRSNEFERNGGPFKTGATKRTIEEWCWAIV